MDFKLCTWRKILKSYSDFYKDTRSKDGLGSWCKDCESYIITVN